MARTIPTAPPASSPTTGLPESEPTAADDSPRRGQAIYVVAAPFASVTLPGHGAHSPAQDKMLTFGQIVPSWVPPAQVANLLRNGIVERVHGYPDPLIEAPAAASTPQAPAVWEPGRRYRVTAAAVVVPGHGSPIYHGATLPKDVAHEVIDRLLERGLVEPKALPA